MTPEFLYYFRSLLVALADRPSRYALYAARNPEASRAYVSGREVPPWGLVRTMLRDLAVSNGAADAPAPEVARAQALHQAATTAAQAVPRPAPDPDAGWSPFAPQERGGAAPAAVAEPARGPRGARFAGARVESAAGPAAPAQPLPAATPRGARFAGAPDAGAGAAAAVPAAPAAPAPRGARFAGAPREDVRARPESDPRWAAEARAAAARLERLRGSGDSGAAYLLLSGVAAGPADRIPAVVRELERAGLTSDVPTLLWELAALSPAHLARAAAALAREGRDPDARTLLHQAASRPAADVALVADLLQAEGHTAEAGALLETVARARPADAAAALATARPAVTGLLLAAAGRVSPSCHRDLAAALARG